MPPDSPFLDLSARAAVFVAMVLFAVYLFYEVWRRGRYPGALTREQFRRRLLGGVLLELDLLLWLIANPVLRALPPGGKLAYLGFAVLLPFVPMYLAIRESGFIARQYAQQRRELFRGIGRRAERRDNGHGTP